MPFGFFEEEDESYSGISGHVVKRRDYGLERLSPNEPFFVSKSKEDSIYGADNNQSDVFVQTKQRRD